MNIYWNNLIKRICQAAGFALRNSTEGTVVVRVTLLMGKDNKPIVWTEPVVTRIEPANNDALLNLLGGGNEER